MNSIFSSPFNFLLSLGSAFGKLRRVQVWWDQCHCLSNGKHDRDVDDDWLFLMGMMISYYEIWDGYILKQKVDPENPSVRETLQLWQQQVLSFEFYCLKKKTAKNL